MALNDAKHVESQAGCNLWIIEIPWLSVLQWLGSILRLAKNIEGSALESLLRGSNSSQQPCGGSVLEMTSPHGYGHLRTWCPNAGCSTSRMICFKLSSTPRTWTSRLASHDCGKPLPIFTNHEVPQPPWATHHEPSCSQHQWLWYDNCVNHLWTSDDWVIIHNYLSPVVNSWLTGKPLSSVIHVVN